jgi:DNA-directed RNA polymerase subunit omega
MSGTVAAPEGITDPPIDELLEAADSKYALVIYAAKRARQINAYYAQLNEGLLQYVGPLVETRPQEKPLSIAMREIDAGLLTAEPFDPAQAAAEAAEEQAAAQAVAAADPFAAGEDSE